MATTSLSNTHTLLTRRRAITLEALTGGLLNLKKKVQHKQSVIDLIPTLPTVNRDKGTDGRLMPY